MDLFSGIGGITYALRGYFEPALYCDIDRACQDVLARHIDTRSLPPGRMVSDVTSIHKVDDDVRAIVAGSPCQSISCMGKKEGIYEGTRSGLFLEIARIVDENPNIDIVFLENVSNILRLGVREVVSTLTERGFSLAWTVKHARGHGAPHKRERWFCLALRGDALTCGSFHPFERAEAEFPQWSKDTEPPRVAVKPQFGRDANYHANWSARQKLLGNSVVPVTVRAAFEELASKVSKWNILHETLLDFGTHYEDWTNGTYPVHALVTPTGYIMQLPSIKQDSVRSYVPSTTLDVEGTLLRLSSWPTPRAGNTRAVRLNTRSMGDLGSMLVHSYESQIYVASAGLRICGAADQRMIDVCVPNTACVEWAMGYPCGWTSKEYPEGVDRTVWPEDGVPEERVEDDDADDAADDAEDAASEADGDERVVLVDSGGTACAAAEDTGVNSVVRPDTDDIDLDDKECVAMLGSEIETDLAVTGACATVARPEGVAS